MTGVVSEAAAGARHPLHTAAVTSPAQSLSSPLDVRPGLRAPGSPGGRRNNRPLAQWRRARAVELARRADVPVVVRTEHLPELLVLNKVDCAPVTALAALRRAYPRALTPSALTGEGLDLLRDAASTCASGRSRSVTNAW